MACEVYTKLMNGKPANGNVPLSYACKGQLLMLRKPQV